MTKRTGNFRKCLAGFAVMLLTISMNAQTLNEVIQAFNAAAGEINAANYEAALAGFESTIELATALGAEGDEMKAKAEGQIPNAHYRIALDKYKAKDIAGAITSFENAVAASDKYGNESVKSKSLQYLPQFYNSIGNEQVKSEDFDAAIASFDKAVEYNPDYAKAYYGRGVAYMRAKNDEGKVSSMEKAIETGTAAGDETTAAAATKILKDHFVYAGKMAYQAEKYDEALANLESSFKYDAENAESYYLIAVIHGKKKDFEETVEFGLKALEYEEDDVNKKAKIYYEIGMAYTELKQIDKACDALGNALVEPYTSSVKHNMENVLKCGQ